MLDFADLLTELCPSYVRRKGGLSGGVPRGVKSERGDTSRDLVDDGDYISLAWKAYTKYRGVQPCSLGTLEKMMFRFPAIARFQGEINDDAGVQRVREQMAGRLTVERQRALGALVDSVPGMHMTRSFNQGQYTSTLENGNGVCTALTLDWVRRKMWNSQAGGDVQRKREVWEGTEDQIRKRMMRVDAMQSRRRNIVNPAWTMSGYDEVRREHRLAKDKDEGTGKSFGALMAAADSVVLKWTEQGAEAYLRAFNGGCAVQGDADMALVVAVNKEFNVGHVFGFFRAAGVWHLFDPNYGEFELQQGEPATMGSKWYEIYFICGFLDIQISRITRKT